MTLTGKSAVITGAASGLGAAFALRAAELGMRLVISDVDRSALDHAADRLRGRGAQVHAVVCDVSASDQVDRLASETEALVGVPNLVINNAGVASRGGLIWEAEPSEWDWVFGVNVMGVAHGIRAFVPGMLRAAERSADYRGQVVNVASMGGLFNPALCGVYSASKHAVVSMSETLHHDLAVVSPRVTCAVVCPYFVATAINTSEDRRPERFRRQTDPTPSQRIGQRYSDMGMQSAKKTPDQVAAFVFDEIAKGRFYILPHPSMMQSVEMRMQDVVGMRPPRDPFSFRPEIAEGLRRHLRDATETSHSFKEQG